MICILIIKQTWLLLHDKGEGLSLFQIAIQVLKLSCFLLHVDKARFMPCLTFFARSELRSFNDFI